MREWNEMNSKRSSNRPSKFPSFSRQSFILCRILFISPVDVIEYKNAPSAKGNKAEKNTWKIVKIEMNWTIDET